MGAVLKSVGCRILLLLRVQGEEEHGAAMSSRGLGRVARVGLAAVVPGLGKACVAEVE